jgi:hypothetical protein
LESSRRRLRPASKVESIDCNRDAGADVGLCRAVELDDGLGESRVPEDKSSPSTEYRRPDLKSAPMYIYKKGRQEMVGIRRILSLKF